MDEAERRLERLTEHLEELTARLNMTLGAMQAYGVLEEEMPDQHRLNAIEHLEEAQDETQALFSFCLRAFQGVEDAS